MTWLQRLDGVFGRDRCWIGHLIEFILAQHTIAVFVDIVEDLLGDTSKDGLGFGKTKLSVVPLEPLKYPTGVARLLKARWGGVSELA
jgi:hypothetical protein